MTRRRLAAIASLLLATAVTVLAVVVTIGDFPHGLTVLACLLVAVAAAAFGLVRRGGRRTAGLAIAALALAAAIVLVALEGELVADLAIVAGTLLCLGAAREALAVHVELPTAPRPLRPVLFFNPLSGGGKAEKFGLAGEARARGIEPIELRRGDNLETLVRDAVAGGADALSMAGGDGSQAIVAAIAAELDLPYACIPAGTRNHFALDLGVDRDDVVGALDAFVDGGERRVDLAEVNGRVFVNNVSLGVYADAVQQAGYRDAKIRTLIDAVPDAMGPEARPPDLRWSDSGGGAHRSALAILVSNNPYRLGRPIGSGTRPSIDSGRLGIAALESVSEEGPGRNPVREWSAPSFVVDASAPIPAGIDGEAARLDPPLRFHVRPRALRVRIAAHHPGASPSAGMPDGLPDAIRMLARIVVGSELVSNRRLPSRQPIRSERSPDGRLRGPAAGDPDA